MWSPSPYATAQLFDELKQGKLEPDPTQAAALGSDEVTNELDKIVDRLNPNIYDFLLKLPGITTRNIGKVMTKVKDLKELIKLNMVFIAFCANILAHCLHFYVYLQEQLTELLGSEANAKMFWEIVHIAHKPVEADASDKLFISKYKRGKRF